MGIELKAKRHQACPIGNKGRHTSFREKSIAYYFRKVDSDIIENYSNPKAGITEIDVFLPRLNIGIEYDGKRWHTESSINRDDSKNEICKKMGITLVRVREYGCPKTNELSVDYYIKDINELDTVIHALVLK